MKLEVCADEAAVAGAAARFIAAEAQRSIAARNRFVLAVSGGHTPWVMLRTLARIALPWERVHLMQVDERVAPPGDPDRNLTHLRECIGALPLNLYPMPVERSDLVAAAADYARTLGTLAGTPPVLDLVHLGMGPDGHTASLVPGDPALAVTDADVTLAGPYQGRRRMTLTYPTLDRARCVLWVATGAEKVAMLSRLLRADASIPAGRVRQDAAVVYADRAAAPGQPGSTS